MRKARRLIENMVLEKQDGLPSPPSAADAKLTMKPRKSRSRASQGHGPRCADRDDRRRRWGCE